MQKQSQRRGQEREAVLNLTPEELAAWKVLPETQEVFRCLKEMVEAEKDWMAEGGALRPNSVEETALLTARFSGVVWGLTRLLEIRPPDPEEQS